MPCVDNLQRVAVAVFLVNERVRFACAEHVTLESAAVTGYTR